MSPVVAILLSGPGDSTSRSRSLTRAPLPRLAEVPRTVLGGSGQERAIRNCPFSMKRVPPKTTVLTPSTTNDFSVRVFDPLLIGGSPVPSMS